MGKRTPKPTDPRETSAAQTGSNVGTAIANAFMQNPTEYGPDGSTRVDQTGTYNYYDSYTGQSYAIPTFTRTTTLSPAQQAIKEQTDAAELNLGRIANEQSAFLGDYLGQPVDMSSENVKRYINDHFADDFNTQWDQRQADFETDLRNRGMQIGSTGFTRAMNDFSTQRANAYDNMYGNQYNNALQALMTERNQPINEITALLSGSQVSSPQFLGANIGAIPTVDNAAIISDYDKQRAQIAANHNASVGGLFGGLFGLGKAMIMKSDDDSKKDKTRIMDLDDDGTGLWAFRYNEEPKSAPLHIGLMASEVEKVAPDAVLDGYSDGYKRVNYSRAISKIIGG